MYLCQSVIECRNALQVKDVMGNRVRNVRNSCINQVLGTDMKKHFDIVSRFQVFC